MTPIQRRAAFERLFTALAKRRSEHLGLSYVGTIRQMPPPPLPGEAPGETHYYANAAKADGAGPRLIEMGASATAALRRAERWVEDGKGPAPVVTASGAKPRR